MKTQSQAHAVDEVLRGAAHLLGRQATRPHDHLGDREVRLLVGPVPALTNSDTSPLPPAALPTSAPLTSFSCDSALVPHMTTQSVSGLTLSCCAVFHPS